MAERYTELQSLQHGRISFWPSNRECNCENQPAYSGSKPGEAQTLQLE